MDYDGLGCEVGKDDGHHPLFHLLLQLVLFTMSVQPQYIVM